MKTLYNAYCDIAQYNNKNIAIIYDDLEYTYEKILYMIENAKIKLSSIGVCSGDNVIISLEDKLKFIVMLLAVNSIGAVAVPMYPNMGEKKVERILAKITPKIMLCDRNAIYNCLSKAKRGVIEIEYGKVIYYINNNYNNMNIDAGIILLTSGTTGSPKMIAMSNEGMISNIRSTLNYLKFEKNERILHIKQLYHSSSIISEALLTLISGKTLVLIKGMVVPSNICSHAEKYKITTIFMTPTMINQLYKYMEQKKIGFSTVKRINFYGAPISGRLINKMLKYYKNVDLIYSYGLTEAGPRVSYANRQDLIEFNNTVGRVLDNVNVYIVKENGNKCSYNEIGEIVIESPSIMKGYLCGDRVNRVEDGKIYTGDLGYINEKHYLFITGRKDNLIIIQGKNIYPEEIEKVITGLAGVDVAQAFLNEKKQLSVKVVCDLKITKREITERCKLELENYKVPKEIIFDNQISMTDTGKIIRYKE